jgi:hypothetical protein
MDHILNKTTVLVLNRNGQAINVRTPAEVFCQMATNVATGLEISGEDRIRPVAWEEWIQLPIREQDEAVRTARGLIRVPTVVVLQGFKRSSLTNGPPEFVPHRCDKPSLSSGVSHLPLTLLRTHELCTSSACAKISATSARPVGF